MLWNTDPNPSAWSQWPDCLNELFQRTSIALLEKDSLKYSSQDSLAISNKHVSHKSWVLQVPIATARVPYYISQKPPHSAYSNIKIENSGNDIFSP